MTYSHPLSAFVRGAESATETVSTTVSVSIQSFVLDIAFVYFGKSVCEWTEIVPLPSIVLARWGALLCGSSPSLRWSDSMPADERFTKNPAEVALIPYRGCFYLGVQTLYPIGDNLPLEANFYTLSGAISGIITTFATERV